MSLSFFTEKYLSVKKMQFDIKEIIWGFFTYPAERYLVIKHSFIVFLIINNYREYYIDQYNFLF